MVSKTEATSQISIASYHLVSIFETPYATSKINTLNLLAITTKCCPFPSPRNLSLPANICHPTTSYWTAIIVDRFPHPTHTNFQSHRLLLPLSGLSIHLIYFEGIYKILELSGASTISTYSFWEIQEPPTPSLPYPPKTSHTRSQPELLNHPPTGYMSPIPQLFPPLDPLISLSLRPSFYLKS